MADTATEVKTPTFTDEMQELVYKKIVESINERNSLVGTINAANGDRLALTEQITEEDTDKEIVKAREARDAAIMALDALVRPKVEALVSEAAGGLDEATAKVKEIEATLKPGLSYYKKMYGDNPDEFPALVRSRSARIGSSGTGGRRIRGFSLTVTANGEVENFPNFAGAAKWLDIDTQVLQEKFFEAAGTTDLKEIADKVSFEVEYEETDDENNVRKVSASVLAERDEPTE